MVAEGPYGISKRQNAEDVLASPWVYRIAQLEDKTLRSNGRKQRVECTGRCICKTCISPLFYFAGVVYNG